MKYAFPGNFVMGPEKKEEKLPMVEVKFFFTCKGTFVTLLRPKLGNTGNLYSFEPERRY